MKLFDETQAIHFIRSTVPQAANLPTEDLLQIIDLIFDFYEINGDLDLDFDDDDDDGYDDEASAEQITEFIIQSLGSDTNLNAELTHQIVSAEMLYESSLL